MPVAAVLQLHIAYLCSYRQKESEKTGQSTDFRIVYFPHYLRELSLAPRGSVNVVFIQVPEGTQPLITQGLLYKVQCKVMLY